MIRSTDERLIVYGEQPRNMESSEYNDEKMNIAKEEHHEMKEEKPVAEYNMEKSGENLLWYSGQNTDNDDSEKCGSSFDSLMYGNPIDPNAGSNDELMRKLRQYAPEDPLMPEPRGWVEENPDFAQRYPEYVSMYGHQNPSEVSIIRAVIDDPSDEEEDYEYTLQDMLSSLAAPLASPDPLPACIRLCPNFFDQVDPNFDKKKRQEEYKEKRRKEEEEMKKENGEGDDDDRISREIRSARIRTRESTPMPEGMKSDEEEWEDEEEYEEEMEEEEEVEDEELEEMEEEKVITIDDDGIEQDQKLDENVAFDEEEVEDEMVEEEVIVIDGDEGEQGEMYQEYVVEDDVEWRAIDGEEGDEELFEEVVEGDDEEMDEEEGEEYVEEVQEQPSYHPRNIDLADTSDEEESDPPFASLPYPGAAQYMAPAQAEVSPMPRVGLKIKPTEFLRTLAKTDLKFRETYRKAEEEAAKEKIEMESVVDEYHSTVAEMKEHKTDPESESKDQLCIEGTQLAEAKNEAEPGEAPVEMKIVKEPMETMEADADMAAEVEKTKEPPKIKRRKSLLEKLAEWQIKEKSGKAPRSTRRSGFYDEKEAKQEVETMKAEVKEMEEVETKPVQPPAKKRGRKPKAVLEELKKEEEAKPIVDVTPTNAQTIDTEAKKNDAEDSEIPVMEPPPRKRGRKTQSVPPKKAKIEDAKITQNEPEDAKISLRKTPARRSKAAELRMAAQTNEDDTKDLVAQLINTVVDQAKEVEETQPEVAQDSICEQTVNSETMKNQVEDVDTPIAEAPPRKRGRRPRASKAPKKPRIEVPEATKVDVKMDKMEDQTPIEKTAVELVKTEKVTKTDEKKSVEVNDAEGSPRMEGGFIDQTNNQSMEKLIGQQMSDEAQNEMTMEKEDVPEEEEDEKDGEIIEYDVAIAPPPPAISSAVIVLKAEDFTMHPENDTRTPEKLAPKRLVYGKFDRMVDESAPILELKKLREQNPLITGVLLLRKLYSGYENSAGTPDFLSITIGEFHQFMDKMASAELLSEKRKTTKFRGKVYRLVCKKQDTFLALHVGPSGDRNGFVMCPTTFCRLLVAHAPADKKALQQIYEQVEEMVQELHQYRY